ncbi:NAD-dependent protein deacetylase [Dyella sp. LX-66]|uniref:NAD-dependent protein deacetylase n=1 Tax=unclassified Dyella TaxID=2634549 RepID=UPI001BDFBFEF|nr:MULTISPECIES: NAD-dependent protein deacetylase [unclassified Dyella]MBT2118426.1 NAD-dependent protein deacetylase [Dyella sp. LX-1]MBT2141902.1 NAD-dependent protein deacetylase [Dyella sp. LX-66]
MNADALPDGALEEDLARLRDFIAAHPRLFVLTGAGVSTDSGIPDYRDNQGDWKRPQPVTYQAFMGDEATRRRYWARSLVGWRRFSRAHPNAAHLALSRMEAAGHVEVLLTQNVDGLHQAAGSHHVIDLHGRLDRVRCMAHGHLVQRSAFQAVLEERNPAWALLDAGDAPDGDADLEGHDFSRFDVPACPLCGGLMKPDVVFFGEGVPRERVLAATHGLEQADAVLVAGSSLMVFSGFRFVNAAAKAGKPIAAVNMGRTRADDLFSLKIERPVAETLAAIA